MRSSSTSFTTAAGSYSGASPAYIAVSLALILGGAGTISAQDYLKPISLYYMLGLGLGQLVLYILFCARLENGRSYDRAERLAETVYAAGLLFVVVIFSFYAHNFDRFLEKGGVLFFKPRNYITTMLLMCMPMTCALVRRSNLYLVGMALMYLAMVMSGSRSGLLFGSVLLLLCALYIYIYNKRSRRLYNWLFGAALLLAAAAAVIVVPGSTPPASKTPPLATKRALSLSAAALTIS